MHIDPLPPKAVNPQSDGQAGEHRGCGTKKHQGSGISLNPTYQYSPIIFDWTFTCEVPNRLQFKGLQDCFEGGHLEVHLLADLHIVMFQVSFLVMSLCKPQQWTETTSQ